MDVVNTQGQQTRGQTSQTRGADKGADKGKTRRADKGDRKGGRQGGGQGGQTMGHTWRVMPQSHGRQTQRRLYYDRGTTEGLDCRSTVLAVLEEWGGSRGSNLECQERRKKVGKFLNMFKNSPDRATTKSVVALS